MIVGMYMYCIMCFVSPCLNDSSCIWELSCFHFLTNSKSDFLVVNPLSTSHSMGEFASSESSRPPSGAWIAKLLCQTWLKMRNFQCSMSWTFLYWMYVLYCIYYIQELVSYNRNIWNLFVYVPQTSFPTCWNLLSIWNCTVDCFFVLEGFFCRKGRPYLFSFYYVQWVLYILDKNLLNSALLV